MGIIFDTKDLIYDAKEKAGDKLRDWFPEDTVRGKALDFLTSLGAAGMTSSALNTLASGSLNLYNSNIRQDIPLGQLFADYASDKLSTPDSKAFYVPSKTRALSGPGISSKNLIKNFGPNISIPSFVSSVTPGTKDADDIAYFAGNIAERVQAELSGNAKPDFLRTGKASLPSKFISKIDHLVVSPRNNIERMAHEFGHIDLFNKINPTKNEGATKHLKSLLRKSLKSVGYGADAIMTEIPGLSKILSTSLKGLDALPLSQGIKGMIHKGLFGMSPPMITALALRSETVRDKIKEVADSEKIDEAMDWVGDNINLTAAIAATPLALNEAYTTLPGSKLVNDFYTDLKSGTDFFKKHPMTNEVLKGLGEISPTAKTLKFIGHNALPIAMYTAPAIGWLVASYLMDKDKEEAIEQKE